MLLLRKIQLILNYHSEVTAFLRQTETQNHVIELNSHEIRILKHITCFACACRCSITCLVVTSSVNDSTGVQYQALRPMNPRT